MKIWWICYNNGLEYKHDSKGVVVDSENMNNAGQNVAMQNSRQNITHQNVVFTDQNLQPVQNPFAQDPPLLTPPPKSKKPILIACIVGAIVLIIAIVGIVCIVVTQDDNNLAGASNIASDSDGSATEGVDLDVVEDVADVTDMEKFKQMTKAEAMAFLQAGRNTAGSMPKNYVGEEITDLVIVENNVVKSDVKLKYSHDAIDDLRQMAEEWYGVLGHNDGITEDDYEIKEYGHYTIVTPNRIEGTNTCDDKYYGDCSSLLSFKSDYINYYQEETTPNSYNDVAYLKVRDPETTEYLLRVFSLFYNYGAASIHGNIYGSSFEEQDDKFVLTVYCVGVGLNIEQLKVDGSNIGYAINLYSRQHAVGKTDGRLHVIRTGENSTVENIKSIPITQEEATSLLYR